MKRLLTYLLLLTVFVFPSCDDDDDADSPLLREAKAQIIGKWKVQGGIEELYDTQGKLTLRQDLTPPLYYFTFSTDGTLADSGPVRWRNEPPTIYQYSLAERDGKIYLNYWGESTYDRFVTYRDEKNIQVTFDGDDTLRLYKEETIQGAPWSTTTITYSREP